MSRVIPVLGIVAAVLGAMAALVFVEMALLLPAFFALGAGTAIIILGKADPRVWGTGGFVTLFAALGIMGTLNNISTEDGSLDLWVSISMGQAFVVASCMTAATVSVKAMWDQMEPAWMQWVWVGVWALGVLFALVWAGDLSNQSAAPAFIVALLSLASMGAPIQLLRQG